MATKRMLTFRSRDLGVNLPIMLCFMPSSAELYKTMFPVVWKNTIMGAYGGSVMTATYDNTSSVCSAQMDGNGSSVIAGTYIPINPGQQSTLEMMQGGYQWTTPSNIGGSAIRAKNGTGHTVSIGCGFITDAGTDREEMSQVVVYDKVGSGLIVNALFTPVVKLYATMNYGENDVIKSEIIGVDPLWVRNLLTLGPKTTIWIRRMSDGTFRAEEVAGNVGEDPGLSPSFVPMQTRLYRARLKFAHFDLVRTSLEAFSKELLRKGYRVKVSTKEDDKSVHIELTLPQNTNCNQAEMDMMNCIGGNWFPHPVAITKRSGEIEEFNVGNAAWWATINPAAMEWNVCQVNAL